MAVQLFVSYFVRLPRKVQPDIRVDPITRHRRDCPQVTYGRVVSVHLTESLSTDTSLRQEPVADRVGGEPNWRWRVEKSAVEVFWGLELKLHEI
jgi:hypothetical protein